MFKKPACLISLIMIGVLVLCCLVIQIAPIGRTHSNPPVVVEPNWDRPRTRELFMRACGDCHSNETVWPWYSNIAPVSWLVLNEVDEGRAYLNVSEWGRGENEVGKAAKTFAEGEMPPLQYRLMHPEARLAPAEVHELIQGLRATFGEEE